MVAESAHRVERSTAVAVNREVLARMERSLAEYAVRLDSIEGRLRELDREWDVERALQLNAAALVLAGVALGTVVDRRWLLLPAAVATFLLQHAVQGWCPPLPLLRRAGVRTAREIERERYALKALRGDFRRIPLPHQVDAHRAAVAAMAATQEDR